jgi:hypothetical protein
MPRIKGRRPKRSHEFEESERLAAVRTLVESFARDIHLPRGVPSAPGQRGYASWRAARERLLSHQLDILAEETREQGRREAASGRVLPRLPPRWSGKAAQTTLALPARRAP